jgi:hypothetical protein
MQRDTKTIVMTIGRFNPPTRAHDHLLDVVLRLAIENHCDYRLYTTPTVDSKKNPLTYKEKHHFLRQIFSHVGFVYDPNIKNLFDALYQIRDQGYEKVILVAGSDRVDEYREHVSKFLNHSDPSKSFGFKEFSVVSAGERDPDGDGVEGISASKMRQYALDDDFDSFLACAPIADTDDIYDLFVSVQMGMMANKTSNA